MKMKESKLPINVTKTATNVFIVKSKTSGNEYTVDISEGKCTCPHYMYRLSKTGGHCKHFNEVVQYLDEVTTNNQDLFSEVLKYIHNNKKFKGDKFVDISEVADKFGDDTIDEMIRLGILFMHSRGRVGELK